MLKELPLELLIPVLNPLSSRAKIKFRAVCKKWRFAIDQYLLRELNLFGFLYSSGDIFLKQKQSFSNPKNSFTYEARTIENGEWQRAVKLEKIKFLFRNARQLLLYTGWNNPEQITDFTNSFEKLEYLIIMDTEVTSIRLQNLRMLEIDESPHFETQIQVIDCPNLVEFWYTPFQDLKLPDDYVRSMPNLRKLKVYRTQKFMRSLKNLEELIIYRFEGDDKSLLKELPKLNFLDVHEINGELFSWIDSNWKKSGRTVRLNYRGLPAQYARNRIPADQRRRGFHDDFPFGEDDLQLYQGHFEQTRDEIHFYRDFYISDSFRQIERSFFRKFVDVDYLRCNEITWSQDELLGILRSFPGVGELYFKKRNFEMDFYEKLVPLVCPGIRGIIQSRKTKRNINRNGDQDSVSLI